MMLPPLARYVVAALLLAMLSGALYWAYSTEYAALDLGWSWIAARLWLSGVDPYSNEATLALRAGVDPHVLSGYPYPFPVLLFTLPLALLPMPWASTVWGLVSVAAIGALPWVMMRRPALAAVVLPVLYFPFWAAMEQAQWGTMMLAFALLSIHWRSAGRTRLAGAVLPLMLMKPQLGIALIAALAAYQSMEGLDRRWLEGAAISTALVWGGSVLLAPGWPAGWLRQLLFYSGEGVNAIHALTPAGAPTTLLALAVAAVGWRRRRAELVLTGVLVSLLLLLPSAGYYNQAVLLLPLAALAARRPVAALVASLASWGLFLLVIAGLDPNNAAVLSIYLPPLLLALPALHEPMGAADQVQ
jgi:hypothetical protein